MAKNHHTEVPAKAVRVLPKASDRKVLQGTIDFLKVWGLDHKPKQDGKRWYFDLGIPDHWDDNRLWEKFADGLAKMPTGH